MRGVMDVSIPERPRQRRPLAWQCGAVFTVLVMVLAAPGAGRAGGASQGSVEASLMGVATLSAPQMAGQTGAGLSIPITKPSLGQTSSPRVTLWDEAPQTGTPLNQGQSTTTMSVHVVP